MDQLQRAKWKVDAHTGVTEASPEYWVPFFVCLSTSVGSLTAHLLPNRDERVGIVQGRARRCFLQAAGIRLRVAYRHHCNWLDSSQRVTAPYCFTVWNCCLGSVPMSAFKWNILAGRARKKLSKLFHLHPCPIAVWVEVMALRKHVIGGSA